MRLVAGMGVDSGVSDGELGSGPVEGDGRMETTGEEDGSGVESGWGGGSTCITGLLVQWHRGCHVASGY